MGHEVDRDTNPEEPEKEAEITRTSRKTRRIKVNWRGLLSWVFLWGAPVTTAVTISQWITMMIIAWSRGCGWWYNEQKHQSGKCECMWVCLRDKVCKCGIYNSVVLINILVKFLSVDSIPYILFSVFSYILLFIYILIYPLKLSLPSFLFFLSLYLSFSCPFLNHYYIVYFKLHINRPNYWPCARLG